jgi:sugar-specific transcriptional regulator TrmB
VEALNSLGLTVYEAKTSIALLQKHPANGKEISRRSGVPGPKIYETLNKMVQKGLVAVLNANPQLYSPLPYRESLAGKKEEFNATGRLFTANLENISIPASDIAVWQLTNHDALIDKSRDLIDGAGCFFASDFSGEMVLMNFWSEQGKLLKKNMAQAEMRGVKMVSIQFGPESLEIGKVFHHVQTDTVFDRHSGELTLVADESVGLFMAPPPRQDWNGFWATNPGVVKLMTNYIRHDIYSNKLLWRFGREVEAEYGKQLKNLLDIDMD